VKRIGLMQQILASDASNKRGWILMMKLTDVSRLTYYRGYSSLDVGGRRAAAALRLTIDDSQQDSAVVSKLGLLCYTAPLRRMHAIGT